MANRLRSTSGRVSFFAFLDMITTVTGVLLLITLLLTLYLNDPAATAAEQYRNAVRQQLDEARAELEAKLAQLRLRQSQAASLTNRVFVVPDADRSGKEPVLIVLSATNGLCTRLGRPTRLNFWRDRTTRISSACWTVGTRSRSGWSFIFDLPQWFTSGLASRWPPAGRSISDTMRPRKTCNTFWPHHGSPGGFYTNSLEMLLDTMCNMLGGIVFIALMVALVAQDTPAPPPAYYQTQSAQLSNDLAAATASNSVIEAELQTTLLRLQDPHLHPATNVMRLPAISHTGKQAWMVIVRYGKLYPLSLLSTDGRGTTMRNTRTLNRQARYVEARPGLGDEAEQGVTEMVDAFKGSGKTNFYFAFLVYDDSFEAFVSARETAARLGFQYGWDPLPPDTRLQIDTQGESVLPQN